ncbi:MAG: T9SS type A sorting domain-containing protein, partial [Bacteroidota bacterium]
GESGSGSGSNSGSSSGSDDDCSGCGEDPCYDAFVTSVVQADGCVAYTVEIACDLNCFFPPSGSHSNSYSHSQSNSHSGSGSGSNSGSGSGSGSSDDGPAPVDFVDISIPCGLVSNVQNSAGFAIATVSGDDTTKISGIRVYGMPQQCGAFQSGSSSGSNSGSSSSDDDPPLFSYTITFDVCPDSQCFNGACNPLVAFYRADDDCVWYQNAVSGSANPSIAKAGAEAGGLDETASFVFTAFPNPFATTTTVRFKVTETGPVDLRVFDLSGKEVALLFAENAFADQVYDIEFKSEMVTDGVYMVRMTTADGALHTRKLFLVE